MFQNRIVLINGACGGLGSTCARKFYEEGASLVLTDLSQEALNSLVSKEDFKEERVLTLSADMTKESEVAKVIQKGIERFNQIHHLINCGGVDGRQAYIVEMEESDFDFMMNANVKGTFFFMKHTIKEMLKFNEGTVVNISSIAGLSASRRKPLYSAAKHAVNGLTKSVALEYVEAGIRINSVCPGSMDTAMIRAMEEKAFPGNPELARKDFSGGIPMKRYAKPDEVADLILFLSSEHSSYITGACYRIDGGIVAK